MEKRYTISEVKEKEIPVYTGGNVEQARKLLEAFGDRNTALEDAEDCYFFYDKKFTWDFFSSEPLYFINFSQIDFEERPKMKNKQK